jgi:hypothetical protein
MDYSKLTTLATQAIVLGLVYFYLLTLHKNCKKEDLNISSFAKYVLFFIGIHYVSEMMGISNVTITTLFVTKIVFTFIEYCHPEGNDDGGEGMGAVSAPSCDTGVCTRP